MMMGFILNNDDSYVEKGHSLGLKVGSYLNNCICMDKDPAPKYEQDVECEFTLMT